GKISIVVVRDLRIGKRQLVEVITGIAKDVPVIIEHLRIDPLQRVEVKFRMQILGEVPGVAIPRLWLSMNARRDHADTIRPARLLSRFFFTGGRGSDWERTQAGSPSCQQDFPAGWIPYRGHGCLR